VENTDSILEDAAGVADPSAAEADTPVTERVERMTLTAAGVRRERVEVLTFPFLRKYLYYAKTRVRPVLSKEAADVITQAYASLRNQEDNKVRALPLSCPCTSVCTFA
jgi:DNA replicative helicase MCM subunit Mcm2 (Cdc46/Mcm family)